MLVAWSLGLVRCTHECCRSADVMREKTPVRVAHAGTLRARHRGTRRKYVPVGSLAASMPPKVPRWRARKDQASWLVCVDFQNTSRATCNVFAACRTAAGQLPHEAFMEGRTACRAGSEALRSQLSRFKLKLAENSPAGRSNHALGRSHITCVQVHHPPRNSRRCCAAAVHARASGRRSSRRS